MKKHTKISFIFFIVFCCPLFSEKYIKEQSFSYQNEKEPVCVIESLFLFDDFNFLKSFKRRIIRGNQITIYNYIFKQANDGYIIKLDKKNDYISSEANLSDTYRLLKINGKWTLLYENQILGHFVYSDKDKKCSFIDYETNEEKVFYEQKACKHILHFNIPYEYFLKNNIYYKENFSSNIKSEILYDLKNEKYTIRTDVEGLESESTFIKNYYCTDYLQICLMWIARYDFGGELLPYLFCKIDRAYHATSYLQEGKTTYEPEHLQEKDGLPWASANGKGIGEVITIKEFEHENPDELVIMNGYQDKTHSDYYEKNSRVKTLKITNLRTKKTKTVTVRDIKEEQRFSLSELGEGGEYEFEIIDVYAGSKYDDLCIQYMIVE